MKSGECRHDAGTGLELSDCFSAGVAHYLAHPAVHLTQTVGVVALDSVGNGRGYRLLFYGTQENDLPLMQQVEAGTAERVDPDRLAFGGEILTLVSSWLASR